MQVDEWRKSQKVPSCSTHDHIGRREAEVLTKEYLYSERRGRRLYHYFTAYWLTESRKPKVIYFNSAPRHWRPECSSGYSVLQLVID